MTQEQKAKAYDEALEDMRVIYPNLRGDAKLAVEHAFPVLAESEDERMWKLIKKYAHYNISDMALNADHITRKELEDWLEKQKDASKAIEAVERIDKYIDEHLANAHDMKDSNPEKKYYRGWDDALAEMSRILQDVYSNEKQKECVADSSKTSASEDERIRKEIISLVKEGGCITSKRDRELAVAYLEKLKEPVVDKEGIYYYLGGKFIYCGYPGTEENPYDFAMSQQEHPKEPHYTKRNALFDKCVENCDPEVMKKASDEVDEMLEKEKQKEPLRDFIDDFPYSIEQKEQKPKRERKKPKESWLEKSKYELAHEEELLIKRQKELSEIRALKNKEQKPEPVFKVGDKIKLKSEPKYPYREIVDIKNGAYYFDEAVHLPFDNQDNWEKEQKPIRDIVSGDAIESCMLRYLQSAANRNDDTEIIEDTKTYKSELISIIEKEQKPADLPAGFYVTLPDGEKYYAKEMRCNGMNVKVVEPKPTEWNANDKAFIKDCSRILDENGYTASAERLLSMFPIKSVEWSEEYEKDIAHITRILDDCYAYGRHDLSKTDHENLVNKLKSLSPQSKDEIHKEKNEAFKLGKHQLAIEFMNYLDENRPESKMGLSNGECEDIDKAFKENDWKKIMGYANKYSWKPSEEQMNALKNSAYGSYQNGDGPALRELYEQLETNIKKDEKV